MENTPGAPKTAAFQNAVLKISQDLYMANPGLTESQRIHIAAETVRRFPGLVTTARGGADYLPVGEEELTECPQCGKEALNTDIGVCHNCGYGEKPGR
jgi:hypothetical protein